MSRQLSAAAAAPRRVLRASRRRPAVAQLRMDIDAVEDEAVDDLPPALSAGPSSASDDAPAAARRAAAVVSLDADEIVDGADWHYDSDFAAESGPEDEDEDLDLSFDPTTASLPDSTSEDDDAEDDDVDYVSEHDSSIDSDAPLSDLVHRANLKRNAPGTKGWKWRPQVDNVVRRFPFTGAPGIVDGLLEDEPTAADCFQLFFTPALWTRVKEETNRYAVDWATRHPSSGASHMKAWKDVDEEELQLYLALRMIMGIKQLPQMRMYWSHNRILGVPLFGQYMSRDRFMQITSKIHFNDNATDPRGDRLWKIRPVIECFRKQFKDVVVPDKDISIDESLFR